MKESYRSKLDPTGIILRGPFPCIILQQLYVCIIVTNWIDIALDTNAGRRHIRTWPKYITESLFNAFTVNRIGDAGKVLLRHFKLN